MRFGFNASCSVDGVLDVVANVIQAGLSLGVSYPFQYLSIFDGYENDSKRFPNDSTLSWSFTSLPFIQKAIKSGKLRDVQIKIAQHLRGEKVIETVINQYDCGFRRLDILVMKVISYQSKQ